MKKLSPLRWMGRALIVCIFFGSTEISYALNPNVDNNCFQIMRALEPYPLMAFNFLTDFQLLPESSARASHDPIVLHPFRSKQISFSDSPIANVALSTDGKRLAGVSRTGQIKILALDGSEKNQVLTSKTYYSNSPYSLRNIAFSPDGTELLAAYLNEIDVWNLSTEEISTTLEPRPSDARKFRITSASFGPIKNHITVDVSQPGVVHSDVQSVTLWNTQTKTMTKQIRQGHVYGGPATISPDGTVIALSDNRTRLSILNAVSLAKIEDINLNEIITQIVFSPDGSRIVVGTTVGKVWSAGGFLECFSHQW